MAQELTLRLNTPIEELIPAMIAFNNAELLAEVKDRLATYQGRIYDETSISAAKADRATLNKFKPFALYYISFRYRVAGRYKD